MRLDVGGGRARPAEASKKTFALTQDHPHNGTNVPTAGPNPPPRPRNEAGEAGWRSGQKARTHDVAGHNVVSGHRRAVGGCLRDLVQTKGFWYTPSSIRMRCANTERASAASRKGERAQRRSDRGRRPHRFDSARGSAATLRLARAQRCGLGMRTENACEWGACVAVRDCACVRSRRAVPHRPTSTNGRYRKRAATRRGWSKVHVEG